VSALVPTPEQQAIVDAARAGQDLVIEAGAGTGKTSTLRLVAAASPRRRGVYLAYNRAIADDAKRAFPQQVTCATAHALAFRAVGRRHAHRLGGPRVPARQTAQLWGITHPVRIDAMRVLAPEQLARVVTETITRFCHSAAPQPGPAHVPAGLAGLDDPVAVAVLRQVVVPLAQRAWADLARPDGRLRFTHDCYLKLWQLSDPRLSCDYVLFDEAQDANPVVAAVVDRQTHAQRVLVGDSCQAIYGWRGAVDALARFPADRRLWLWQSFRFGPAIAAQANRWLALLDAPLRLRGFATLRSTVGPLARPDAVLCRTNAEAIRQVLAGVGQAGRVALVGGGDPVRRLAQAAITLKAGQGTDHPELFAFGTWAEVQDYAANDHAGHDLKVLVDLVDAHGPEQLIDLVDRLVSEPAADLVVSTAHKAKGREWPRVQLAGDFPQPQKQGRDGRAAEVPRAEAMLAYVAVTRARQVLDPAGLAPADQPPSTTRPGGTGREPPGGDWLGRTSPRPARPGRRRTGRPDRVLLPGRPGRLAGRSPRRPGSNPGRAGPTRRGPARPARGRDRRRPVVWDLRRAHPTRPPAAALPGRGVPADRHQPPPQPCWEALRACGRWQQLPARLLHPPGDPR
jgi:hypothetical protein